MRTFPLLVLALLLAAPAFAREVPDTVVDAPVNPANLPPGLALQYLEDAEDCVEFAELAVELGDKESIEAYLSCVD